MTTKPITHPRTPKPTNVPRSARTPPAVLRSNQPLKIKHLMLLDTLARTRNMHTTAELMEKIKGHVLRNSSAVRRYHR